MLLPNLSAVKVYMAILTVPLQPVCFIITYKMLNTLQICIDAELSALVGRKSCLCNKITCAVANVASACKPKMIRLIGDVLLSQCL